jgi:hypothetical protein
MLHDWKPSLRMESHCLLPVEMRKHRFLICARSALVMKPAPLGCIYISRSMMIRSDWSTYQTLLDGFFDFLDLDFREAANLEKVLAMLSVYSLMCKDQTSPIE